MPKKKPVARTKKTAPSKTVTKKTKTKEAPPFPIVGIGASAGGLEALERFFKAAPPNSGIAFVVVVHLDPKHVSIMPELLQKSTKMPVHQAIDGITVKRNHVYVIPPNKDLTILNGRLILLARTKSGGSNLPIDTFFRSLASEEGRNAVCIILSGTGTDGTLGLKAIKGEAGMVMAQTEDSAKYDGMPRSAIATRLVDYVMPPETMPTQLIKYSRHAAASAESEVTTRVGPAPQALQKIFAIIRSRTDHDFSLYKKNTICRRIERRMNLQQIDDITTYVRFLQESDREADTLFKELLIGVTNFFRDPEAFEILQAKVLPKLLESKPDDYTFRVWVPGCASGEEAYSVAILLSECFEKTGRRFSAQIFGTDIDEDAIAVARAGLYPDSIVADVGPDRLRRYFTREEDGRYRVRKAIRERLVFASQNVIKDPPFTKLDLLCCRNLLIYLGSVVQRRLLPIFHYSLKPEGILFLGSSETIGQSTDLFALLHKKWKIFRRQPSSSATYTVLDFPGRPEELEADDAEFPQTTPDAADLNVLELVETILEQSDTPPCVIINDASELVYVHGRTGRFLEPAEGKASAKILDMARPGLKRALAAAIRQAAVDRLQVVQQGLRVQSDAGRILVNITVRPILEQRAKHGLMMIVFEEIENIATKKARPRHPAVREVGGSGSETLKAELRNTRENLQTTIEQLETSNEELKSTNEELQSTNEELQSTNEELETSKEELQSLNEESTTVNAELQARIDELTRTNDDMKNLLDSTGVATIFLDTDLRIRRFTPAATTLIPLTAADFGRPISHLTPTFQGANLTELGRSVLQDLATVHVEVQNEDLRYYSLRVRPYRTMANVIDGVVIIFDDVTELKRLHETRRLAAVVRDSNDAVALTGSDGAIVAWNRGAEQMYGYSEAEALEMNIVDMVPPDLVQATLDSIAKAFRGEPISPVQTRRRAKDGRVLDVWITTTLITEEEGRPFHLATTEREITTLQKQLGRTMDPDADRNSR